MLAVLRINNLAIVESAEIDFTPGLNVLTGETGAGKSIILKAVGLLAGQRASSDAVRTGAEKCIVEGLFAISPETREALIEIADEMAELDLDDELLIRRVVERSGRSKIYLNGSLSTAGLLQRIAVRLIDITGQHQQHSLLMSSSHLQLLDDFGVDEGLRVDTSAAYQLFAKAAHDLERFLKDSEERARYFERIKAEHEELSEASIALGERAELDAEMGRLANVETLGSHAAACMELLEHSDGGAEENVRGMLSHLEAAAELDPKIGEARALVESASVQLSEAKLYIEDYQASLEDDPGRLEFLRERITLIARLERKYGKPEAELVQYAETIGTEIADFEGGGLDEKKLRARVEETRTALDAFETKLTTARKKAATQLSKDLERELKELNMKRARFKAEVLPCESGPNGADRVEFTLAANPGEPFRPLSKVASGGELSRILLVLKTLLNERSEAQTQIFDEIDTGIGGAIAQTVGEKLKQAASRIQVLLVTHSPQIAALADTQFHISKHSTKSRTETQVARLNESERTTHIASMMAGKEVSEKFIDSAQELLSQGKKFSSSLQG